jgi:hypothetical protein
MIRTIAEYHQSYQRLIALAKKATPERREKLLKLARLGLKLAQLQLRDPSHRPDTRLRMSADQYRAIAEWLVGYAQTGEAGALLRGHGRKRHTQ